MKYIRTKDNIYESENAYIRNDYWIYPIEEESIIKQADTIEELCDEFVIESDSFEKPLVHTVGDNDTKEIIEMAKIVNGIIYGAIWTDKGLIYVAKMNEKGELELL